MIVYRPMTLVAECAELGTNPSVSVPATIYEVEVPYWYPDECYAYNNDIIVSPTATPAERDGE
jgi:hypothetical protein